MAGDVLVAMEGDKVSAEVCGADILRAGVEVFGELADAVPVGLPGAFTDGQELQVIGEGF